MANTNKTKAEILQELESIKGLLLEEDDIPILQDAEIIEEPVFSPAQHYSKDESVLPGQGSLFDETNSLSADQFLAAHFPSPTPSTASTQPPKAVARVAEPLNRRPGVTPQTGTMHNAPSARQVKATGENPFLPQHIRERLHGNNPPPLFEYEGAKNVNLAARSISSKYRTPRLQLIEEVVTSLLPHIESELRNRLFAMSVEELERILNEES